MGMSFWWGVTCTPWKADDAKFRLYCSWGLAPLLLPVRECRAGLRAPGFVTVL